MMRLKATFLTALLLLATLGCAKTTGAGSVVGRTQAQSKTTTTRPDLASYFFATQIEGPTYLSIRDERIAVTRRILADLGHMKN